MKTAASTAFAFSPTEVNVRDGLITTVSAAPAIFHRMKPALPNPKKPKPQTRLK